MGIFLFYLWHAIRTGKKTHATAKRKERQKRWLRVPVLQFDSLLYESVCLAVELTVGKDVASQSSSLLLKGFNLQDWKIGRDISCNLREEVSRQQERNQRDTFFFSRTGMSTASFSYDCFLLAVDILSVPRIRF